MQRFELLQQCGAAIDDDARRAGLLGVKVAMIAEPRGGC